MDGLPGNFPVAGGRVRVCGAPIEVDENTGRALHISRVNETVSESNKQSRIKLEQSLTHSICVRTNRRKMIFEEARLQTGCLKKQKPRR